MENNGVKSEWLHEQTLDGVDEFRVTTENVDLAFEADDSLRGAVQLIVEPAQNGPVLRRSGSALLLEQEGRYRGRVTPLIRVPVDTCPRIDATADKGDLSFSQVTAPIAGKLGVGDLDIQGGSGDVALSLGKGDVAISNRAGAIAVKVGMGDIEIRRAGNGVAVAAGKGDITLSDCAEAIDVRNGAGDVAIVRPGGGSVSIRTGSGDIAVSGGDVQRLSVRTGKGDIASTAYLSAATGSGAAEAQTQEPFGPGEDPDLGTFDVGSINIGDFAFEASEAGLRVGRGDRDLLRMGSEGIQISRGGREISLGPSGIRVGGAGSSVGPEHFTFETGRGDIHVEVPADLALRVEILATGDVQSDVPVVSVGRPGPRGTTKRLVGVRDGGDAGARANVRLKTGRGDVALRTVTMAAPKGAPHPETQSEVDRDERARVILEALARGELNVAEAERLLAALDRSQ